MHIHRTLPLGFLFAGIVLAAVVTTAGCGPNYPTCDTDKDCKPKEFCVARKCQQCRDTRDCPAGSQCNAGKCGAISGYCTDRSQCASGQECIANRCRPCESDGECGAGLKCMQGQCKKAQCVTDNDCPQDKDCQNGMCVGKAPAQQSCNLGTVYFGFDQSNLTSEATSTLNSTGDTLKKNARNVDVVGRADPRGTTEYNMALSDRRAQAVKDYLQRLGVDANKMSKVPRGALDATGSDEAGWAKDRRVDFECR
jgi:peptidoglycan-associated lipoprotein